LHPVPASLPSNDMAPVEDLEVDLDLLIVGAGISGLQALRECLALGLRVRALEKEPTVGGTWSGHGVYDCMQVQQHKEDFFLPGMPWPASTPSFAKRDDVVAVTERYVAENGLLEHVECRSEAVSARYNAAWDMWTTRTSAGTVWTSRFIAFAVGTLGPPRFPKQVTEALACFGGDVVHSSAYFRPLPYEGRHVVVLGYGASSVEIAHDLARNGRCASVSLVAPPMVQADGRRQGLDWCLSRALPGRGSRFCSQGQAGGRATLEARNALVRDAMRTRHPEYPECMPPKLRPTDALEGRPIHPGQDGRPLGGRIIVSEGFLDCVSDGSVKCYAGYLGGAAATSVTVMYKGEPDVSLRCDAVVVATGYEAPTDRIAAVMSPRPASCETLYDGMWMADVPNAALVGHVYGFVAVPPFAGLQAKYLARVVSGACELPPAGVMQAWVRAVQDKYKVTQILTENKYFRELRTAALGAEEALRSPTGAGPPADKRPLELAVQPAALAASAVAALAAAAVVAVATKAGARVRHCTLAALTAAAFVGSAASATCAASASADDGVATAAGEALTYLMASRGNELGGDLCVMAVGGAAAAVTAAISARLHESERCRFRPATQRELLGTWAAADESMDLVVCSGPLDEAPPEGRVVSEALRVLKPGGHAVLALRDRGASRGWHELFDAQERPVGGKYRWRLVHKTAPRPHARGGKYRQYVFRVT